MTTTLPGRHQIPLSPLNGEDSHFSLKPMKKVVWFHSMDKTIFKPCFHWFISGASKSRQAQLAGAVIRTQTY